MAPSEQLEHRMKLQCQKKIGEPFLLGMRYALDKNLGKEDGEGADGTVWFAKVRDKDNPA